LIAEKHKMMTREVSAKTGENVEPAVREFVIKILKKKVKLAHLKDIYMTMLLHLNDDFDDDLLQDAMEILVDL
jgi:hypothetical protein